MIAPDATSDGERAYWWAWLQVPNIGPIAIGRLRRHFGTLRQAWEAPLPDLRAVAGIGDRAIAEIDTARRRLVPLTHFAAHLQTNPHLWTPADPAYPTLLRELPDLPPVLYYAGTLMQWDASCAIAIVGTRDPSGYGRRWAHKLGRALAERDFVVVSGLAEGVDTEAHRGCLEAGGMAIAVVGTGVDRVYPPRNEPLYRRLLAEGLVLSEYPAGTGPERAHFPQRNRIIAGLCRATLVIEAPRKSGALITAHLANDYGRDVFALPGSLEVPQALGCLDLIARGAQVILGVEALLEALGAIPRLAPVAPALDVTGLEAPQHLVLAAIARDTPTPFDRIVSDSGLPAGEVSAALLQLELLGAIAQHPGMRYQRL